MNLLVDTGSSWTWVATDNCKSTPTEQCEDSHLFHHRDSVTYKSDGKSYDIKYGSGVIKGKKAYDSMVLPGMPGGKKTGAKNFPFLSVDTKPSAAKKMMSGIIGLSPKDDSAGPLFVDYLYKQKQIPQPQYTIQIHHDINSPKSFIAFGGLPVSENIKGMHCHKISGSFHWELKLNKFEYNNVNIPLAPVTVAFMDTGATLS